ncbi:MAG TPA: bifunctional homocysteine S-methyltransferase/methylenetetrahydrofolate reductase [Anaerolineae bacterium]|nr:bifunctional homocysteine S-methyltransferase/methylenetetrahydrofolate reductase [Anaerolineae bacterium]
MASNPSTTLARHAFAQRVAERPLLLDGAMGTLLYSRGIPQRASIDELVLSRPEVVGAVHREYIAAGADIIETDSFSASRIHLAPLGLADRTGLINRRAAQLAREAREVAGKDVLVAGSIGPVSSPLHGPGHVSPEAAASAVSEQLESLLEGGIDLVQLETTSDLAHLLAAVEAARRLSDLPLVASMTFGEDLNMADGSEPAAAARALLAAGVDVIGVNCGSGPIGAIDVLERLAPVAGDTPLLTMPNAGLSGRVGGEFVWAAEPAYFAAEVPRFLAAGARLIGGCCGTTPAHIAAMRQVLDREQARRGGAAAVRSAASPPASARVTAPGPGARPRTAADDTRPIQPDGPAPTGLATALAAGRFVVSVEIDPPRSVNIERTLESAELIRDAGADLVNISDSAMARVRMGAMAVGFAVQRDLGLESLIHFTTRDRNLMALESELLGAHALGIRDILALTGDPPRVGDYPGGTGIWDIDSIGLIGILQRLNRGEDQAGRPIGGPAGFTIACALDPTAEDLEGELARLAGKIDAGAHLIMTQPIYARAQWDRFMERASARWGDRLPRPVLFGVLPLHTARHAEFLHHEVPGITIPQDVRAAMHAAGERGAEVGLEQALELLSQMRRFVSGTYIMPSFGRYEQSAELVRRVRAELPAEPPASQTDATARDRA